ncbi:MULTISPECIES: DUF5908 family protein [Chromobacterium]|uniref:DUF5908 family protein n=1 Tax=Chromobacterium TaxID=535 RepID=UPI001D069183|nr:MULTISPECIES: DUF5908 family protein [Chromobacterium]MCP1293296.1 DUF5908 family protein [Chromobacterium sp. S0633]UJB32740.1 hypothetical protein HQN78_17800 [Chromobacterium sp. Beijing]
MIEIHELIIQVRVDDTIPVGVASKPQWMDHQAEQSALIELITEQVLARLREKQEDWA